MKRLLVLTAQAKTDLERILLDIAADSSDTAERLRLELYHALRRLGDSPAIGHYREELLDRRYRFWNFYSYVVVYAWQRKPIIVIAVIHGRRDLATYFGLHGN